MTAIEPPGTISNSLVRSRRPRILPGAPRIDSDVRASSEGRPSSSKGKRTLIFVCILLLTSALHAQTSPWRLTWSDEFSGPNGAPPDPAKWAIVTAGNGFGNGELQTYTSRPANVQQRDGHLVITAQKEDFTGPDGISRNYTSARINTKGLFAQPYGRFEASMQLPIGKGIWPALWLLGANDDSSPWPDCGEIDIMEAIGAPGTIYSTLHGPGYNGKQGISAKFPLPAGESIHTTFHLYAVEWSPNDIKFFFDDHLIAHRTPADLPPNTTWVYDHPFYLLLNLAVGGYWPGKPDATTVFPQQMLVDYVRVYTRTPSPSAAATKPGRPYIDSDVRASSEGRASSSPQRQDPSKPAK